MPQLIMTRTPKVDGSVRKATFAFVEKLMEDDTLPGLHIEPINGATDPRVRTGRVNDFYRAVLVKLQGTGESASYVYLGTYPHDEAIALAKVASVRINPRNGVAELVKLPPAVVQAATSAADLLPDVFVVDASASGAVVPGVTAKPKPEDREPLLRQCGHTNDDLVTLGIDPRLAMAALAAVTEDALLDTVVDAPTWQATALLDLATGTSLDDVRAALDLGNGNGNGIVKAEEKATDVPAAIVGTDDDLLAALRTPAAQMDFAFIGPGDVESLRAAIEDEDFGQWRIFLHPEQRKYAYDWRSSSFRLSGGAGTGKTVVLVHRAVNLSRKNPAARIVLTTYTTTLAEALKEQVTALDPDVRIASDANEPGIYVVGIDKLARRILARSEAALGASGGEEGPVAAVLGARSPAVLEWAGDVVWNAALDAAGDELPPELRSKAFLQAEYNTVVLPARIRVLDEYLRARRPGRGVRLNRATRAAVWSVIEAYRAAASARRSTDWDEKAMVAATLLDAEADAGKGRIADHVLVDEGQDLTPARLLLARALVAPGANDLFLAEDSHQRIYGPKVVLSRYGINIRGRSRRLTLNYRTTAQNLGYAVAVLADTEFVDLDAEENGTTKTGYRSARSGPPVTAIGVPTLADEYRRVADLLAGWRKEGHAPETTGILVRTSAVGQNLQRNLAELGEETRLVVDDKPVDGGRPLVMTMHRAKGMEFRKVILFGINDAAMPLEYVMKLLPEADQADALAKERSLLYVAATRARDELVVIWEGTPSTLLPATVA